ncbi:30S ribosomal protein S4 [Patescibacteria group bacterium]|nr:30S ribosomal protein S4 [Patescibacteria group bacterium]MBU4481440.1 30S ribosomal protein S4 [Patescibacteria group bacterium]
MQNNKCKICRRLGVKLFLKGERCFSVKCQIVRRPYPPGIKKKRRRISISEYASELTEKQRLKNLYQLRERQFRRYVERALSQRGKVEDATVLLIKELESRLDNVVFRLGFASSRAQAKQLVSHGHFLVNKKTINVPSCMLKKGDEVSLKENSAKKAIFKEIKNVLKKQNVPPWLKLNAEALSGKVIGESSLEGAPPVEISEIFEYYSR